MEGKDSCSPNRLDKSSESVENESESSGMEGLYTEHIISVQEDHTGWTSTSSSDQDLCPRDGSNKRFLLFERVSVNKSDVFFTEDLVSGDDSDVINKQIAEIQQTSSSIPDRSETDGHEKSPSSAQHEVNCMERVEKSDPIEDNESVVDPSQHVAKLSQGTSEDSGAEDSVCSSKSAQTVVFIYDKSIGDENPCILNSKVSEVVPQGSDDLPADGTSKDSGAEDSVCSTKSAQTVVFIDDKSIGDENPCILNSKVSEVVPQGSDDLPADGSCEDSGVVDSECSIGSAQTVLFVHDNSISDASPSTLGPSIDSLRGSCEDSGAVDSECSIGSAQTVLFVHDKSKCVSRSNTKVSEVVPHECENTITAETPPPENIEHIVDLPPDGMNKSADDDEVSSSCNSIQTIVSVHMSVDDENITSLGTSEISEDTDCDTNSVVASSSNDQSDGQVDDGSDTSIHQHDDYVLLHWENNELFDEVTRSEMQAMWELPQLGQFLNLTQNILNLKPLSQFEIERMLLMPEASRAMAAVMTALLCSSKVRRNLQNVPPMPYKIWMKRLSRRVNQWYNTLNRLNGNYCKVF